MDDQQAITYLFYFLDLPLSNNELHQDMLN